MANISAFQPVIPNLNDIISFDDFFGTAKRKFPFYYGDGYYQIHENKAFLIQRVVRNNRSHTGIIACAHVEDYINGEIKKHEHTLTAKEKSMAKLFDERKGVIKPILLTYPNVLEIDALINRLTIALPPSFQIPFQDEEHSYWLIERPDLMQRIKELFNQQVPVSYICDGHHRAFTAQKLYEKHKRNDPKNPYNFILAAYYPASEVVIHNYNRLLVSLKGRSPKKFMKGLEKYYEITPKHMAYRPLREKQMGLYLDKKWYKLNMREKYIPNAHTTPTAECLDVHLFNKYVLKAMLNIKDVRTEAEVKYMDGRKGPAGLESKVDEEKAFAAFNLYPVALEDLIDISNVGGTLPPKSTYIEPRMRNGFIAQMYEQPM